MIRIRTLVAVILVVSALSALAVAGSAAAAEPPTPPTPPPVGLLGPPGPVPPLPLPGTPPPPGLDPFYGQPGSLDSVKPGTVLRSRSVSIQGLTTPNSARAYQLLYRTSDAMGRSIATVTTLLIPTKPAPGPRKLVSYHIAEDSLTTNCAPSYLLRTNSGFLQLVEPGEISALLANGWDVAVPDYEGPRSEFLSAKLAGRAALDSARAAERFAAAELSGPTTQLAMLGYSGGSLPTIWANALAHDYAPELNLVGVAAGGILADPQQLVPVHDGDPFAGAIVLGFVGLDRAYPDIKLDTLLTARGRALAQRDARDTDGCGVAIVNAPLQHVSDFFHYLDAKSLLAVPPVRKALQEINLIRGPTPHAPAYFFQSIDDEVAPIAPVDELVQANCEAGAKIEYYRAPIGEHLTGITYLPPAIAFIQNRFDGRPPVDTCTHVRHANK